MSLHWLMKQDNSAEDRKVPPPRGGRGVFGENHTKKADRKPFERLPTDSSS
jgi:hypothetical protein